MIPTKHLLAAAVIVFVIICVRMEFARKAVAVSSAYATIVEDHRDLKFGRK